MRQPDKKNTVMGQEFIDLNQIFFCRVLIFGNLSFNKIYGK
jgi:hypothetical protein